MEVSQSLRIGAGLIDFSQISIKSAQEVKNKLIEIIDASDRLSRDTKELDEFNKSLLEFIKKMETSFAEQTSFLRETGATINEIITAIENIASGAIKKQHNFESASKELENQSTEVGKLTKGFTNIE